MNDSENFSYYLLNFFFCFFFLWQLTREFSVRLSTFYHDVICRFSFFLVRLLAAAELDNISSPVFFSLFFSVFFFFFLPLCVLLFMYVRVRATDRTNTTAIITQSQRRTRRKKDAILFFKYIYAYTYNWLITPLQKKVSTWFDFLSFFRYLSIWFYYILFY